MRKGVQRGLFWLKIQGDLGPFTMWTSRQMRVSYMIKEPPKREPSRAQVIQRDALRRAMLDWKRVPIEFRPNYELAGKLLHFTICGHNVFVACHMRGIWKDVDEMERLTGLRLPHPPDW